MAKKKIRTEGVSSNAACGIRLTLGALGLL